MYNNNYCMYETGLVNFNCNNLEQMYLGKLVLSVI